MGSTFCYWNLHHYTEFTVRLDGNTDGRRINMLKELRIQNFKGWKDTGTIRLAPISLFFGANSSGKSSIGQLLIMLKQTVESQDRKAVFYPGGKNSAVQLGSYQEMVFHRNPKNKISFDYRWSLIDPLKVKDPLSGQIFSGNELDFSAEVDLADSIRNLPQVAKFKYRLLENDKQSLSISFSRNSNKSEYTASSDPYSLFPHLSPHHNPQWKNLVREKHIL